MFLSPELPRRVKECPEWWWDTCKKWDFTLKASSLRSQNQFLNFSLVWIYQNKTAFRTSELKYLHVSISQASSFLTRVWTIHWYHLEDILKKYKFSCSEPGWVRVRFTQDLKGPLSPVLLEPTASFNPMLHRVEASTSPENLLQCKSSSQQLWGWGPATEFLTKPPSNAGACWSLKALY